MEKIVFFEGQGERKVSREELTDIVPQPLFLPPPNQASPFLVNNSDVTILFTVSATSHLCWWALTEPGFIRSGTQMMRMEVERSMGSLAGKPGPSDMPWPWQALLEPTRCGLQPKGIRFPGQDWSQTPLRGKGHSGIGCRPPRHHWDFGSAGQLEKQTWKGSA